MLVSILAFGKVNENQSLKVLSFNIWDPGDEKFWQDRGGAYPCEKLLKYITEDNCDILLLQEVTLENNGPQSYSKLQALLEKYGYIYSSFYRPDYSTGMGRVGYVEGMKSSGYPLAIFSKIPILETFAIQKFNNKKMHKGVLGVKLRFNKQNLFVFNTHLGIGEPHQSEAVSKVLTPFVNQLIEDTPALIAGDWNSPPEFEYPDFTETIGKYTYSSNTTKSLIESGFVDSYTLAKNVKGSEKDVTYPSKHKCLTRIDRFYIKNLNPISVDYKVKKNLWDYLKLSDHKGVVVEYFFSHK